MASLQERLLPYANGNVNMATMNPFDEYNTEDAAGKGSKKKDKKTAMKQYEYESIQRQYGNKKYGEYTIEDKKNVINYYKKQKKGQV